ncbi:MAG: nucleotidyltransferase family protein [Planctomycetes bacterium]|uniref:nucleotidyltransferase family protein n=1 Tax=Candidatus Wunengus sp. YC65 TaxID=3367701 RepID=UPI001D69F589|nr:nucleotidyltransferase family protein [Planctomycetota bacterium]
MIIQAPLPTKKDILSVIRQNQEKIKALGVKKLGLFGSFTRGEQNAESDIDLLVEFEQDKKTFNNFIQLSFLLEEILQRSVELVTAESLSPYVRPHIIEEVEDVPLSA